MQVRFAVRRKARSGQDICRNCESGPLRAVDPRLHTKAPATLAFEVDREDSSGAVPNLSVASTHQQDKTVSHGQIWLMLTIEYVSGDRPERCYDLYKCQRVLTTIIEHSLPDSIPLGLIQPTAYERFPSQPGVPSIRHLHAIVGNFGHERGQHRLQRVRPCERWMVNVISHDWEQVPETRLDFLYPIRELWQPRCEFREPLRFEGGIDNDTAALPECTTQ